MITDCLAISDMLCPTTRAMMSFGPPAGNGTISLIGLVGKSCAEANAGNSSNQNPVSSLPRILMTASPDPRGEEARLRRFEPRGRDVASSFETRPSRRASGRGATFSSTVEQLHRRLVDARVAGGDDAAAALGWFAVPGGDDTAGAGDDRDEARDI